MKLLELLPQINEYGRVKRKIWNNCYLVRSLLPDVGMISCDFNSMQMGQYIFTYEDLVSADWEILM